MSPVEEASAVAVGSQRVEPPLARPGTAPATTMAALLILAWFVATAWMRPLATPDEGRYVGIAWEMLRSGDWLTPTLDGLPYFHKPPLFYWISAASMAVFGVSDLTARAAPIVGAWLGTFGLYLFTQRWCGERPARLAATALAVMPLVYLGGQYANMDMLVAGFISASVLLLADAAWRVELGLPYRRGLVAGYAMAALGVLSKGLIGAALPLFVIVAWLLATRRLRLVLPLISAAGLAVLMLITLPWFAALQWRFTGFLDYFFIVQQVKRFAETGFNNARPFWFFPVVLVGASLPWLPWFRPLLRGAYWSDPQRGAIRWLMLLWLLVVTVFFSLPQSKLPGYILPAVPPLGFFVADALSLVGGTPAAGQRSLRLWLLSACLSALIGVAVVVAVTLRPPNSARELARVLVRERAAGERVFMLERYYFDVPVYARLAPPFAVVDAWDEPAEIRAHDNWRKELADAGEFAPARAASSLVTPARLRAEVCAGSAATSWFIGSADDVTRYDFLKLARVESSSSKATLWRVDTRKPEVAAALGCGR